MRRIAVFLVILFSINIAQATGPAGQAYLLGSQISSKGNISNIKGSKFKGRDDFSYGDFQESFSNEFVEDYPSCSKKVAAGINFTYQMADDINDSGVTNFLDIMYSEQQILGIMFNYTDRNNPCEVRRYAVYFADGSVLKFDVNI